MKEWVITGHVAAYHFRAPNLAVAAVAVLLAWRGKYGVQQIGDPSQSLPVLRHRSQADAWAQNRFGMTMRQVDSRVAQEHAVDLVNALESVTLGMPGDGKLLVRPHIDLEPKARRLAWTVKEQLIKRVHETRQRKMVH